jgi:hypothetical protein
MGEATHEAYSGKALTILIASFLDRFIDRFPHGY